MKRFTKKIFTIMSISFGAVLLLYGLLVLFMPKLFTTISAIVLICISLAIGLIFINPIPIIGIIAGALMLILPKTVSAIIFFALGVSLCILAFILHVKAKKQRQNEAVKNIE